MAQRRHTCGRWPATATLAAGLALAGCADGVDDPRTEAEFDDDTTYRLGRVHVLVEPAIEANETDESPLLQISARFAYFRGLDEEFVRARIDMPVMAQDVLQPSHCITSDRLSQSDAPGEPDGDSRELVLVDVGNLRVDIGETVFDVPISLVPDLLPYMSGVAYHYEEQIAPSGLAADASAPVTVSADGSRMEDLGAFTATGSMPVPLDLTSTESDLVELDEDILVVRWRPAGDPAESVVLQLESFAGSEPTGDAIACVFADLGSARLDMPTVRGMGLGVSGDALQISASRMHRTTFDAGELTGGELVVEVRDQMLVALP